MLPGKSPWVVFLKCVAAGAAAALFLFPANAQKESPDAQGKKLLENVCGPACHPTDFVTSRRATKDEWRHTVEAMVKKGADATEDEFQTIVDYLARNFAPNSADPGAGQPAAKLNVNKATAEKLASFLKISAAEAAAVARYREANGNFARPQPAGHVGTIPLHAAVQADCGCGVAPCALHGRHKAGRYRRCSAAPCGRHARHCRGISLRQSRNRPLRPAGTESSDADERRWTLIREKRNCVLLR